MKGERIFTVIALLAAMVVLFGVAYIIGYQAGLADARPALGPPERQVMRVPVGDRLVEIPADREVIIDFRDKSKAYELVRAVKGSGEARGDGLTKSGGDVGDWKSTAPDVKIPGGPSATGGGLDWSGGQILSNPGARLLAFAGVGLILAGLGVGIFLKQVKLGIVLGVAGFGLILMSYLFTVLAEKYPWVFPVILLLGILAGSIWLGVKFGWFTKLWTAFRGVVKGIDSAKTDEALPAEAVQKKADAAAVVTDEIDKLDDGTIKLAVLKARAANGS